MQASECSSDHTQFFQSRRLLKDCYTAFAIACSVRVDMAETKETRCIRLELRDDSHVYLRSSWETANFSIIVFDGYQAWSRCVSTMEVTSIARQWNINVGDFMRSARARLSCQHPTSKYSMSGETDADVVNLSFGIDDLWEGESLDFKLRMEAISDVRPVVCEMLDYLADTNKKLKEQLIEAETQLQKKARQLAAASESEPSITLSLARSSGNNNPRRQGSSFLEPRLLDFTKFKPLEDRDAPRRTPTRAHGQPFLHDTSMKNVVHENIPTPRQPPSSFDLPDHGITKQTPKSNLELDREDSYFPRSGAAHGGRIGRNNDLTVNMVALSPNIMRVLHSLSNGIDRSHGGPNLHDDLDMGGAGSRDERGLKIMEMRSHREDQSQRSSFMLETNSSGIVSAPGLRHKLTAPENSQPDIARDSPRPVKDTGTVAEDRVWNTSFSGMKKIQENHHCNDVGGVVLEDRAHKKSESLSPWITSFSGKIQENHHCNDGSGVTLEKSGSNVGDLERRSSSQVSKYAAEVEAASYEERTSEGTLEDAHLGCSALDSNLRVKAGLSERFPWRRQLNEARTTEDKHEKLCQDPTAGREPRRRQESPAETTGKQSSVTPGSLWKKHIMDADVTTPSASKREKVLRFTENYSEEEEEELEELEETPEHARYKSTCCRPPAFQHQGRKRSMENREDDSRSQGFRPVKLEVDDSETEETRGSRKVHTGRSTRKSSKNVKQEVVELDDNLPDMPSSLYNVKQDGGPSRHVTDVILASEASRGKGNTAETHAFRTPEKHRRADREENNVVETNVPDPDFYNFDRDRTEDLVQANQIWAVYDEKDEMPRAYARIDKVYRSPRFEVAVTWLKPYQPSEEAKQMSKSSGYAIACGEFEYAGQYKLAEINCFSHRMAVGAVSTEVVEIYPSKGEVWALYTRESLGNNTTTTSRRSKSRFRLAELLEDLGAGKSPMIQVLRKVRGLRSIWTAEFQSGYLPTTNLARFSHRIPAYQLQGHELPNIPKGSWDIDPAGLPASESEGDL